MEKNTNHKDYLLYLLPIGSLLLHVVNVLFIHKGGVSTIALVFPVFILPSLVFHLKKQEGVPHKRLYINGGIAMVLLFAASVLMLWV